MSLRWPVCLYNVLCAFACAHSDGPAKQHDRVLVAAPAPPLPQVADKPPALPGTDQMHQPPQWSGTRTFIELIDTGSEPRRPMTYAIEPGSSQTVEVIADAPTFGPRTVETVSLDVLGVEAGWVTVKSTIIAVYAEARPTEKDSAEQLTRYVSPIVGSTDVTTTSIYGEAGQRMLTATDYATSVIESRGLRFHGTVPFPRAAIGVGATWKVTDPDVGDGVESVETVTLSSIEKQTLKVTSSFTFTYVPGDTPAPVHGTSEWTVRLNRIAASGTTHVWRDGHPEDDSIDEFRTHD